MIRRWVLSLHKTARKFWASVGVVTQEIQDIIGSPIVKEAIINNSDVVMLLDQSKFREQFDEIKAILGLTDVDCKKIFTVNRLDNKEEEVSSVRCLSDVDRRAECMVWRSRTSAI